MFPLILSNTIERIYL